MWGNHQSSVGNLIQCLIQIYTLVFNYEIHKLFLCMPYINIESLFVFSILAGVSVCYSTDWSCVCTLYGGHYHHSTFNYKQHIKAKPDTLIY